MNPELSSRETTLFSKGRAEPPILLLFKFLLEYPRYCSNGVIIFLLFGNIQARLQVLYSQLRSTFP